MAKDKVDDIFNDFESKVKGKKEIPKKEIKDVPKKSKDMDEGGSIDKKYEDEKHALKEKYKQELKAIEQKRVRELVKEGKLPQGPSTIERVGYISVIVILVLYIAVDLSFYHGSNDVEIKSGDIVDATTQETPQQTAEDETASVEEQPKAEPVPKPEPEPEPEEDLKLSGKIVMGIDKVITRVNEKDDDLGYIDQVIFTIDNGKSEVLKPIVVVYAYDNQMEDVWKTLGRGEYRFSPGIEPGGQQTGTISLSPKTFRNLNIDKDLTIELNSTSAGFLTSASKKVAIS